MKKKILALTVGLLSIATFAQKNELKALEKAINKKDLKTAKEVITSLEAMGETMDDKYKGKYLFLKGRTFVSTDVKKSAEAFQKLFEIEKASGKSKYTNQAKPILESLIQHVSVKALRQYNNANYKNAKDNFFLTYKLSPKDTTQLYNAALTAMLDKDYDIALKHFIKLRNLKYKGIVKEYYAVNKASRKVESFSDKASRDMLVKASKTHINPTQKNSKSKQPEIVKNIGYIYVNQGQPELAIKALSEARKENPKDVNLILHQAQMYSKLKKMDKFGELMEEATKLDSTNPILFFNLGVINQNQGRTDKAKEYYQKAIELKPDYKDAFLNMAAAILSKEREVVDEMNNNLSNDKKYDELKAKQKEIYKKALPYIEKADSISRNIETVKVLLNIYDVLEMTEKGDELRPIYKEMRE